MPFVAQRALGWTPCEITADWGLRDLPTGHAQALCTTLRCTQCQVLFLDMRFDAEEMGRLYQNYRGPAYEAQREALEPGYAQRNRGLLAGDMHIPLVEDFIRPWVPDRPAVLDWGGDTGRNTPLRQRARLHHVLDISGHAPVTGAVAVAAPADIAYDLIVLAHVLEHIPEPATLLLNIVAAMASTTRLYVEVPFETLMRAAAIDSQAWRRKRHWHEHINFFSEEGLHCLLARCGLRVLAAARIPLHEDGRALALALLCELC